MPFIHTVKTRFPRMYKQAQLKTVFTHFCKQHKASPEFLAKIGPIFDNTHIQSRGFLFEPFSHSPTIDFKSKFREWAKDIASFSAGNINATLEKSQVFRPRDLTEVITSCNLPCLPPMGTRIMEHLNLPPTTRITNQDGSGCLGGVEMLSTAHRSALANPKGVFLSNTVDSTSLYWNGSITQGIAHLLPLTHRLFPPAEAKTTTTPAPAQQRGESDPQQAHNLEELMTDAERMKRTLLNYLVIAGLTGDGASSIIQLGNEHPLVQQQLLANQHRSPPSAGAHGGGRRMIEIVDCMSYFMPGTMDLVSQTISNNGFDLRLSGDMVNIVPPALEAVCGELLAKHKLTQQDLKFFLVHPGGPKILKKTQQLLGLQDSDLALSWQALREVGNAVGSTVVRVLETFIETQQSQLPPLSRGLMLAVGPGLKFEAILLRT